MIVNGTASATPPPGRNPDRIAAGPATPLRVLPASQHQPARLGHQVIGQEHIDEDLIAPVAFGPNGQRVNDLPQPCAGLSGRPTAAPVATGVHSAHPGSPELSLTTSAVGGSRTSSPTTTGRTTSDYSTPLPTRRQPGSRP